MPSRAGPAARCELFKGCDTRTTLRAVRRTRDPPWSAAAAAAQGRRDGVQPRARDGGRRAVGHQREHQQPPVGVGDDPRQAADAGERAGLGPDGAAPGACGGADREPVVERAVAARDGEPGEDRAQELLVPLARGGGRGGQSSAPSSRGGTRSSVDRPLPSTSTAPVVSKSAWASAARICSAAPVNDGSPSRTTATSRASASARTLSDVRITCSTSSATGADATAAEGLRPGRGGALGDGVRVGAEQLGERAPRVECGFGDARPVLQRGVDPPAVEHQRLDRRDEAAGHVGGRPARAPAWGRGSGRRRPAPA